MRIKDWFAEKVGNISRDLTAKDFDFRIPKKRSDFVETRLKNIASQPDPRKAQEFTFSVIRESAHEMPLGSFYVACEYSKKLAHLNEKKIPDKPEFIREAQGLMFELADHVYAPENVKDVIRNLFICSDEIRDSADNLLNPADKAVEIINWYTSTNIEDENFIFIGADIAVEILYGIPEWDQIDPAIREIAEGDDFAAARIRVQAERDFEQIMHSLGPSPT